MECLFLEFCHICGKTSPPPCSMSLNSTDVCWLLSVCQEFIFKISSISMTCPSGHDEHQSWLRWEMLSGGIQYALLIHGKPTCHRLTPTSSTQRLMAARGNTAQPFSSEALIVLLTLFMKSELVKMWLRSTWQWFHNFTQCPAIDEAELHDTVAPNPCHYPWGSLHGHPHHSHFTGGEIKI